MEYTNVTVLMHCILLNEEAIIKVLLGFSYKTTKLELTDKPLVNVNAKDNMGRTALSIAIKPSKLGTI